MLVVVCICKLSESGCLVVFCCEKNLRLAVSSNDEFEVFVTPDGDTVWNGQDESAPEYIHEILKKMQADAEDVSDSGAEAEDDDDDDGDMMPIQDKNLFAGPDSVRMPVAWISFFHAANCFCFVCMHEVGFMFGIYVCYIFFDMCIHYIFKYIYIYE